MALGLLLQMRMFPPQGLEVLLYCLFILSALWALSRGPKLAPRFLLHPLGAYLLFEMWRVGDSWPLAGFFTPALYLLAGFAYPPWSLGYLLGAFWGGVFVLAPLVWGRSLDFWPHFAVGQIVLLSLTFLLARFRELHGQMRFWREQALTCPLTGLPNRRALEMALEREAARVERGEAPFALVLLDLDDFKQVNDTFGHQAGDDVLCRTVQAIRSHVRSTDFVFRIGGDEFAVLLPGTDAAGALRVARTLIQAVSEVPVIRDDVWIVPEVTVGVATYPDHGETAAQLVLAADAAMYRAREMGSALRAAEHSSASARPTG